MVCLNAKLQREAENDSVGMIVEFRDSKRGYEYHKRNGMPYCLLLIQDCLS